MAKIYRRDNLVSGVTPKKKNEKNRKRSEIVNFRVTPEEKQLIDERIALSGLPRAEFFIQSCMHQKVITFGNVKTFDAIKKKLIVIDEHLQAVGKSEELDLEILESLRMILEMLAGLEREDEVNGINQQKVMKSVCLKWKDESKKVLKKQRNMQHRNGNTEAQKAEESKKRTHRLCVIGGAVESVLGYPIEEEDIPKLIGFLKRQEANGRYFSKAMQKEQIPETEEV